MNYLKTQIVILSAAKNLIFSPQFHWGFITF